MKTRVVGPKWNTDKKCKTTYAYGSKDLLNEMLVERKTPYVLCLIAKMYNIETTQKNQLGNEI